MRAAIFNRRDNTPRRRFQTPSTLEKVDCIEREYTGGGSYTKLKTTGPPVLKDALPRGPVNGPWFQCPGMNYPACSLLWLENGMIDCLELAGDNIHGPNDLHGFWFIDDGTVINS